MEKKTSVFNNGLIWFGAALSIAEILTGTLLAPLGFSKGLLASFIGHAIGCVLLYMAGIIGAKTNKTAMETVALSFGKKGSVFFSVANVIQLVGWTAVMIVGGASAVSIIVPFGGTALWSVVIAALIIVWILIGITNLGKVNVVVMSCLFVLTIILSRVVFGNNQVALSAMTNDGGLTFGQAVELSIAMPLSWLPLIADYTKNAAKPKRATLVSSLTYFVGSMWMYAIGLGAAIFTGSRDVAQIMLKAGLGIVAVIIIVGSTVTTTFLDVYSAGVSFMSITKKLNQKLVAIIVCVVGALLAIFTPIQQYETFLYFIGSVFAPMISILITDYFILKKPQTDNKINILNCIAWCIGFVIYRLCMTLDTPIGNTVPVMIITGVVCLILNLLKGKIKRNV